MDYLSETVMRMALHNYDCHIALIWSVLSEASVRIVKQIGVWLYVDILHHV